MKLVYAKSMKVFKIARSEEPEGMAPEQALLLQAFYYRSQTFVEVCFNLCLRWN
jgi:hypothetical protein